MARSFDLDVYPELQQFADPLTGRLLKGAKLVFYRAETVAVRLRFVDRDAAGVVTPRDVSDMAGLKIGAKANGDYDGDLLFVSEDVDLTDAANGIITLTVDLNTVEVLDYMAASTAASRTVLLELIELDGGGLELGILAQGTAVIQKDVITGEEGLPSEANPYLESYDIFIGAPVAGAFTLDLETVYNFGIVEVIAELANGSLELAVSDDGTPIPGLDEIAVTTTKASTPPTTAPHVVALGSKVVVTLSDLVTATGLALKIVTSRT